MCILVCYSGSSHLGDVLRTVEYNDIPNLPGSSPVTVTCCSGADILLQPFTVLGLLVWTLIAGTEYFLYPAFGWVMFVAVFYWVLTVFFLIIYMTMTYTRIPQVPWTMVGLCFNGSAFVLYLIAAIVDASSVTKDLDNHNYNSWAASSFFAFVVTSCYAGNTYFSFISWRSRTLQ
uniref:CKLF like MARVEL transmembrane domain containing 8 n=1 Tax=Cyanistes caeruleus TaxID=156563 RepID=A0A8C0UHC1_CYACU